MKEGFDILNNAIYGYIVKSGMTGEENLNFITRLSNIILNSKDVNFVKYNKKYSLKESDKLATSFLDYLNQYYKEYYEMRKEDGTIIFNNNPSKDDEAFSSYDPLDKKRIIYIPLQYNLEDCFAIVHELMHDINMDISMESNARYFYTESLSILGEFLLEDYLKEKNIKQYKNPNSRTMQAFKHKAISTNLNIKLLKTYLKDGYIDINNFIEILNTYPKKYYMTLQLVLSEIEEYEVLTLDKEQPYIIGSLISTYMYDRIKNNKNNIMELFELNQMLKYYSFDQVLDYLELDTTENDLTEGTYQMLEEKYKKYLKSR